MCCRVSLYLWSCRLDLESYRQGIVVGDGEYLFDELGEWPCFRVSNRLLGGNRDDLLLKPSALFGMR